MILRSAYLILFMALSSNTLCAQDYIHEEQVPIAGYDDHVMEPFLSRSGRYLFFNNSNAPGEQTDLHFAVASGMGAFSYGGIVKGVNSSKLDGVPTMDSEGRFYFVSMRSYDEAKSTIHVGDFSGGEVRNVRLLEGDVSPKKTFWFNMDVEISANGNRLYTTDNRLRFFFGGGVSVSNLFVAERQGDAFHRIQYSDAIFETINTDKLEYAAAISADEKTIIFNRTDMKALRNGNPTGIGIYIARRETPDSPFGQPQRIEAITGFAEGATISPDGCILYYHRKPEDRFALFKVTREDCLQK